MPVIIDGVKYFPAAEVALETGVARQTLWRWRQQGKVAPGLRFRDRQLLFTVEEFEQIRDYANRLEPASAGPDQQLNLFNPRGGSP